MNHGLFDLQVNGFAGVDFQRPEITHADLERAAEALRRHQTTGILFTLITDTIERWDAEEASRRIELHVGRDLQFIRINGTVVGALRSHVYLRHSATTCGLELAHAPLLAYTHTLNCHCP